MAKRGLHFKAPGPAKRPRHTPPSDPGPARASLEGSLSEELLVRCLSFLSAHDLVSVSRVSSGWHRLAQDSQASRRGDPDQLSQARPPLWYPRVQSAPVADRLPARLIVVSKKNQLWRPLYLSTFAPAAQRSGVSHETGPTPPRHRPWKELYKISANWRRGAAKSSSLIGVAVRRAVLPEAPPSDLDANELGTRPVRPPPASSAAPAVTAATTSGLGAQSDLLLQFKGSFFLTASRQAVQGASGADAVPAVTVLQTLPQGGSTAIGSIRSTALAAYWSGCVAPAAGVAITELRLDEAASLARTEDDDERAAPAPVTVRLAVFFSTGQASISRISLPTPTRPFTSTELHCDLALSTPPLPFGWLRPPPSMPQDSPPPAFDPVTLARLHGPLMVTCSEGFVVRFWLVEDTADGAVEVAEAGPAMQTHECHLPVILCLEPVRELAPSRVPGGRKPAPQPQQFRVSVVYATPVYPAAWTVALQEFNVQLPPAAEASRRARISARHVAARAPPGSDHSLLTSVEFAPPFLVASRNNNTIDVFELVRADEAGRGGGAPAGAARRESGASHGRQGGAQGSGRRFVRRTGSSLLSQAVGPAPMSSLPRAPLVTPHTTPTATRPRAEPDPLRPRHQLPPVRPPLPPPALQLVHRRTLFGHTGSVRSVAVSDGKCVSGGADGQVKVWDLTGLSAASAGVGGKRAKGRREGVVTVVQEGAGRRAEEEEEAGACTFAKELARGGDAPGGGGGRPGRVERVWFDEEQIVSVVEGEGVRLLRFD